MNAKDKSVESKISARRQNKRIRSGFHFKLVEIDHVKIGFSRHQ